MKGGTGETQNLECDSGPVNGCALPAHTEDPNDSACIPVTYGNCGSFEGENGCKKEDTNANKSNINCFF